MCIYFLVPMVDVGKNAQLPFYKIMELELELELIMNDEKQK